MKLQLEACSEIVLLTCGKLFDKDFQILILLSLAVNKL